jgi:hypothetical protein
VHELCKRPDYPHEDTIYHWLQKFPDFSEKYLAAREQQADLLVNDLIPIADGERPTKDAEGQPLAPGVQVRRDSERIKVRMWKAGRMSPRKWGELANGTDMGAGSGIAPPILIIRSSDDVRSGAASKANRRQKHQRD